MANGKSNAGRHFTLGTDLRVQSSQGHNNTPAANNSNLRNIANAKHVATYSQPVQGPLNLSTFQQMARDVHATRPGMSTNKNTVGIFHQSALQPAQNTGGGNRALDTRQATVMLSNTKTGTATHQPSSSMTFAPDGQKNHFTGNHN
jgi:hypothetical protein